MYLGILLVIFPLFSSEGTALSRSFSQRLATHKCDAIFPFVCPTRCLVCALHRKRTRDLGGARPSTLSMQVKTLLPLRKSEVSSTSIIFQLNLMNQFLLFFFGFFKMQSCSDLNCHHKSICTLELFSCSFPFWHALQRGIQGLFLLLHMFRLLRFAPACPVAALCANLLLSSILAPQCHAAPQEGKDEGIRCRSWR